MNIENRIAIITGASQGIGFAVARELVDKGAVVYAFARNPDRLEAARSQLGDALRPVVCDVGVEEQVRAAIERVLDEAGRIDILVNNAGIGLFSKVDEIESDDWHRLFDTNVHGVFYCTKAAVPIMKRQNEADGFGGHIINVASVAGLVGNPALSAYNHTKFGLRGFSDALMKELRHDGIKVTGIYPGSVATEFFTDRSQDGWKIQPDDLARTIVHVIEAPDGNLISDVVIRPLRPPRR